ncbi:MAG: hypothetical protein JWM57_4069 [Phycisphaerales bacterium]|nr:hypothetical protein [Phycisphaerales bacterium]
MFWQRSYMRNVKMILLAAFMTASAIGVIGCSSDDDDHHHRPTRASDNYRDRDHDGIRDGLEDRNRDGVRDGQENGGRNPRRDPDLYR